MKFLRPLLGFVLLAVLIGAAWLWWTLPSNVDMADYAPADSIVYMEFNNLTAVAQAIQQSRLWQTAAPLNQIKTTQQNRLALSAAKAGLGPLEAVLFARTQIALVVLGMNTAEENDTLKIRPEFALIAETHTSKWRTKSAAVNAVKQLATHSFGVSNCTERSADADYIECSGGDRKIVGAIDGTLIVLGNSDNAVRSCLEVRRGVRPSIRTDPELLKLRSSVTSEKTLGFGYVSPANSAKLFSFAAPLLMGQGPVNQQLERVLAASAGKILRGAAWTASSAGGEIEDRFLFSLEPQVVSLLQPAFEIAEPDIGVWAMVPDDFESLTIYDSKEPEAAWSSLNSAVSFKLDAVPAVLFGSILKSGLSSYGINDPRGILENVVPPVLTLKLARPFEGSVFLARVGDKARTRELFVNGIFKENSGQVLEGIKSEPDPQKEFSAVFVDEYLLLGKTESMRSLLTTLRGNQEARDRTLSGKAVPTIKEKVSLSNSFGKKSAAIRTYSNDEARLKNFISTLLTIQGRRLSNDEIGSLQDAVLDSLLSYTETRLNASGIERTTRSQFGQFGTLVSLLQSNDSSSLDR